VIDMSHVTCFKSEEYIIDIRVLGT